MTLPLNGPRERPEHRFHFEPAHPKWISSFLPQFEEIDETPPTPPNFQPVLNP